MMLRLHCLSGSSWHLRGLPDFPPFVLPFLHVSPYVVSRRSCYCWCCLRHSLKAVGRNSTPGVFSHFAVCNLKFISIFILVINQLNAQNLFYSKFIIRLYMFRAPCAHRQEVKIVLYVLWYHHTCRWPCRAQSSLKVCTGRPPTGVMIPDAV